MRQECGKAIRRGLYRLGWRWRFVPQIVRANLRHGIAKPAKLGARRAEAMAMAMAMAMARAMGMA